MATNLKVGFEIRRKIFHLQALIFPLLYLLLDQYYMVLILCMISFATLYADISRHYNPKIKALVQKIFGTLMRRNEMGDGLKFSGASFMALGLLLTCLFFPKNLTITSWLVLIIADCLAAIIGVKYGHPIIMGKSIEGSSSFFAASFLISMLTFFYLPFATNYTVIFWVSLIVTFLELFSSSIGVDDNLAIPISYCLFTTIIYYFFI